MWFLFVERGGRVRGTGDVDVVRRQVGLQAGEHRGVGGFQVAGEGGGVEQGCGQAIAVEPFAKVAQAFG